MSANARSRARAGFAALIGIVAVGVVAPPVRAQQSLADVARKEEERRKTIAAPAKVYTNKDLNAAPAGSAPTLSAPAATRPADDAPKAAEGGAPKLAETDEKAPAKDQKYWAARLKSLQ